MRRGDRSWPTIGILWLALALLLPVIVALAVPLSAVDLAYAVRAGSLMLERGEILRADPFTFTAGGSSWLNQQWLAQVIFALLHGVAGWPGLVLLRAALVGLSTALLFDILRRSGLDRRGAAILTLVTFVVVAPALALRAQLLAIVLFTFTLWLLANARRHRRAAWLSVPLAALWANVHGTFALLPATLVVASLGADRSADPASPRRFLPTEPLLVGATLLATLVNPFGLDVWGYALGLATSPVVSGLASEWQPTSPTTVPGALFLATLVASVVLVARAGWRPSWPTLAWLAALALLALRAERAIVWWALAAAVALGPVLARGLLRPAPAGRLDLRSPANAVIIGALVAALLAALPSWRADPSGGPGGLLTDAPADLTRKLAGAIALGTRAYVTQPWASWVEYALPEVRTFVDSRLEVVPPAVWEDYRAIAAAAPDWQARLDRWAIDLVIVDPSREPELAAALEASPGWELVAEEEASDAAAFRRVRPSTASPPSAAARRLARESPGAGRTS